MTERLRICSTEQYWNLRRAFDAKTEIDILGQKYAVTDVHWDAYRGGFFKIAPLQPATDKATTSEAAFESLRQTVRDQT